VEGVMAKFNPSIALGLKLQRMSRTEDFWCIVTLQALMTYGAPPQAADGLKVWTVHRCLDRGVSLRNRNFLWGGEENHKCCPSWQAMPRTRFETGIPRREVWSFVFLSQLARRGGVIEIGIKNNRCILWCIAWVWIILHTVKWQWCPVN